MQKYQEQATVTRLKKTYSILNQAFLRAVDEHGTPDTWDVPYFIKGQNPDGTPIIDYTGPKIVRSYLTKYLKGKECDSIHECMGKDNLTFYSINNYDQNNSTAMRNVPVFQLEDGTIIMFGNMVSPDCTYPDVKRNVCGDILVSFPNKRNDFHYGIDNFMFNLEKTGIEPHGRPNANRYKFEKYCDLSSNKVPNNNGHGCTAWIILNGNMDFLHCRDQLSWDGKHSCK